jgi:hypothetical protein
MAQLTEAQKDAVTTEIHQLLSARWFGIALSKSQIRNGVDIFDENLETCESNILSSVGQSAQTWLQNNPKIARWILEMVAQQRREEL